jgi:hypothetical protein
MGALLLLACAQGFVLFRRTQDAGVQMRHFAPGDTLPALTLRSLAREGGKVSTEKLRDIATSPQACTMVIFFSSTCQFVQKIALQWKGVRDITRDGIALRVLWVNSSPSDTRAARFVRENHLFAPVFAFQSDADARRFGAGPTPETYIVSRHGEVWDSPYPDTTMLKHFPVQCRSTR